MSDMIDLLGTDLPNGYVIKELLISWGGSVVLAYTIKSSGKEWATWEIYGEDLSTTTNGHYFTEYGSARTDFAKRVAEALR